jgi:methylated-DNA-[protein]-cysteine S-methyltransferase
MIDVDSMPDAAVSRRAAPRGSRLDSPTSNHVNIDRMASDQAVGVSASSSADADRSSRITWHSTLETPVGPLLIGARDDGICLIEFHESKHRIARDADWREGDHPLLEQLRVQLREYFAGTRRAFDLPLAPRGTPFQREVWHALATIPYGETVSYAQLAARVGRPTAMRAVGAANGRNPLPIVLPCHRVIGANGALTGFGGGLPTKEFLLRLEGATAPALFA